ncbi:MULTISPECIES: glycine zipper 2TM domain-containing protein [unclassified Photobacterium]|uniref:glycine zipper 2TM domain-containing protein n=1 Tax=unclassified Photobacterium TaxID=2628852 RepID=UPI000D1572F9|nr:MULTISPECIES: glycine zipper 2TM domain-containing protein [unclassified Photobacterium]PSV26421.1 hypothetical protein C9J42_12035 [Photobacterium sp. GB-56]PSV34804.1 hypothetical protein C9J44_14635 [Photobacterium sp. GB-27]PSV36751.1 hypothetical protein C9J38_12310 [Photobacterium sp. GB-210]PSV46003.1 hypothetical protein C9J46_05705 [Photobacterium sp. GB-36]PSV52460.1 hypothetical protein C9J45_11215 [Photobacterium sp. GB-1]
MKKYTVASLCLVAALGVSGCAQNPYGNAYDVGEARTVQNVLTGTIIKLDAVTMSGGGENMIGTIAGGAIGAILGSKVGGGSGSDIAAIGGGLAGAALGNKAGDAISQRNGVNIVIKLDSGRTIAVVQEVDPNMIFRVGQRVDIYQQGNTTRVVPGN